MVKPGDGTPSPLRNATSSGCDLEFPENSRETRGLKILLKERVDKGLARTNPSLSVCVLCGGGASLCLEVCFFLYLMARTGHKPKAVA